MGPRNLNSLQLEGRRPKEPNKSCYIKKNQNVLPVGKTDLEKDRGNKDNTCIIS